MMPKTVALLLALALTACAATITPQLDASTGSTVEQRCIDYRIAKSIANARGIETPTADAFIAAYCD
jgi:hypothetical protein